MQQFLISMLDNWKSTAANLLTLVIMSTTYLIMQPSQMLTQLGITAPVLAWLTVLGGLAKVWVGFITKDAI